VSQRKADFLTGPVVAGVAHGLARAAVDVGDEVVGRLPRAAKGLPDVAVLLLGHCCAALDGRLNLLVARDAHGGAREGRVD
jgi:hypothetical protein